jgi:hypothetical protein
VPAETVKSPVEETDCIVFLQWALPHSICAGLDAVVTFDIGDREEMLQLLRLAGVGSDAQQEERMDGDKHAGNSTDVRPMTATRPARIFVGIKIADELAVELAALARPLRPHDVRLVPMIFILRLCRHGMNPRLPGRLRQRSATSTLSF